MQDVRVGDKYKSSEGHTYTITDIGVDSDDILSMVMEGDKWPIILTRDRLDLLVKIDGWVPVTEKHKHRFAEYVGFTDKFIYCKDCGEKV